MITVLLRDSRDSLRVWLCTGIVFLAVGFSASLLALLCADDIALTSHGLLSEDTTAGIWSLWGVHVFLTVVVACIAIGGCVCHVFDERSQLLARLSLAGATPGQCMRMLAMQTMLAALCGTLLGGALACCAANLVQHWILARVLYDEQMPSRAFSISIGALSIGLGATVFLALLSSFWKVRALRTLTPARQARISQNPDAGKRHWIRVVVSVLMMIGTLILILATAGASREQGTQTDRTRAMEAMQTSGGVDWIVPSAMGICMLCAVSLTLSGDWLCMGVLRACNRWLPMPAPISLAFAAFTNRPQAALAQINPMTLAIALPLGVLSPMWSFIATVESAGLPSSEQSAAEDMQSMFAICALPLLIAVAVSIVALVMEQRRQMHVMALNAIAGATPTQLIVQQCVQVALAVGVAAVQSALCIIAGTWWSSHMLVPTFGTSVTVFPLRWWSIAELTLLGVCELCVLSMCARPARALPELANA